MKRIVVDDELEALTPERAWQEISRALLEATPSAFIETLRDCGALARILPEVDVLFGIPQPEQYHPEIDTGVHILMVLDIAAELSQDLEVRFAALLHDLGKGLTPHAELPRHVGHESRGVPAVQALCRRLRVPTSCEHLARLVCRHHLLMHQLEKLRPATVLRLIMALDAVRKPHIAQWFALACEADSRGRAGREGYAYPQRVLLRQYCDAVRALDLKDVGAFIDREGGIAAEVERRRVEVLERVRREYRDAIE
jgi:tRNA nucleotidyltransferase (CCA-adding enzyme)